MTTLLGKKIGPIGYGLMGLTNPSKNLPQDQAIQAMKQALTSGANFWNGGEFYGTPSRNSLHLLKEYFTQYPQDADKVVLSIKGAMNAQRNPDGSPEGVRRSVENCVAILGNTKTIDLFECARIDPDVPVETTIGTLAELVKEGKIGGISLSEVRAETIRRAAKVHPITAVEVEVSLWQDHVLTDGVADVCAELGIPIIAYSPIGRGFLSGELKSIDDIPEGDLRRFMPRFQPNNFGQNLVLVEKVRQIADRNGISLPQVAINWVRQLSETKGRPIFIPIPGASKDTRVKENSQIVSLSDADKKNIDAEVASFKPAGDRYPAQFMKHVDG